MIRENLRWMTATLLATILVAAFPGDLMAGQESKTEKAITSSTATPIKHVVIIFQENVSFDHYFGTYPNATNPSGETQFAARPGTPSVNGLTQPLLSHNLNQDASKTTYQPVRLDPSQNYTCDQNHEYTPEQQAFDSGLMDKFPEFTAASCSSSSYADLSRLGAGIVMGYYDGNTVTALWNYAQYFALNQSFFETTFGPSTLGALNVVSGMTGGVDPNANIKTGGDVINNTITGDPDPFYDDCSSDEKVGMLSTNQNIGNLLNAKKISWGWFQGGFTPSTSYNPASGTHPATPAVCATATNRLDETREKAYVPHHNSFQYYASTSNPHHLPPASVEEIGYDGQANHVYDLSNFWVAALSGNLPAVSYLKATRAQNGHPGSSSPLDEQAFLTDTLNKLQSLAEWNETAVIIAWDDSDGWYDHVIGPIINQSGTSEDALTEPGACGNSAKSLAGLQARCGYGPRLPMLVISPYAKENFVDSTVTDQSSVVRFIEENWGLGQIGAGSFDVVAGLITNMFDFKHPRSQRVFLDTTTGQVVAIENQ